MSDLAWLYGSLGVMAIALGLSLLFDLVHKLARRVARTGRAIDAANRHPDPMLDRLRALLSPATRRKLYMTLALVTGTLVTAGLIAPDVAEHWTGLVLAGFDALALVLATVNALRWNRAAIYATGAAVLSAVVGVGWLSDAQASQVRSVGGLLLGLAAVWLAAYRTDPDTPTGEPRDEYVGRHEIDVDARLGLDDHQL